MCGFVSQIKTVCLSVCYIRSGATSSVKLTFTHASKAASPRLQCCSFVGAARPISAGLNRRVPIPLATGPLAKNYMSYRLWVTIPRTEEVHDKSFHGNNSTRTSFVLLVHCKGALVSPGAGAGSAQTWQLKKRYGYFERVHKVAAKCADAIGESSPALPRRKLNHRDPRYLQVLREALQAYLERVIDVVERSGACGSLEQTLSLLELPVANDAAAWDAGQATRFAAPAGGRVQPVSLEGYLRKQGGSKAHKEKAWRERWFVLTGSSLHYFAHPDAKSPKGARLQSTTCLDHAQPRSCGASRMRILGEPWTPLGP